MKSFRAELFAAARALEGSICCQGEASAAECTCHYNGIWRCCHTEETDGTQGEHCNGNPFPWNVGDQGKSGLVGANASLSLVTSPLASVHGLVTDARIRL